MWKAGNRRFVSARGRRARRPLFRASMTSKEMIVRTLLIALAPFAFLLAGCRTVDRAALSDYDHVWNVCTDVVSSLMDLDEADKSQGRIRAHLASKWRRSRAVILITRVHGLCDVEVNVLKEEYTPYVTSAGVKTYERWRPAGRDTALENKIVSMIRARL